MSQGFEGIDGFDPSSLPTVQGAIKRFCLGEVTWIVDRIESSEHPKNTLEWASSLGAYAYFTALISLKYLKDNEEDDAAWHRVDADFDGNNPGIEPGSMVSFSIIHNPFPLITAGGDLVHHRHFLRVPSTHGLITLGTTEYVSSKGVVALTATIPYFEKAVNNEPLKLRSAIINLTSEGKIKSEQDDGYGVPDTAYPVPDSWLNLDLPMNTLEQSAHERYKSHLIQLARKVVLHTLESMPEDYFPESEK